MKKLLFVVVLLVALVTVAILTGFFANHPGIVAGLVVTGIFLVLLTGILAGSLYSAWLMRKGAEIVIEDRKATVGMGNAYAGIVRETMRQIGPGRNNTPALPLPSQEVGEWLPSLTEFDVQDADFSEIEER